MAWLLELVKEGHKHPSFALLLSISMIGWVGFSVNHFAMASDLKGFNSSVEELKASYSGIKKMMERNAIEQRIHAMEKEVFDLQRVIGDGGAREMDHERLAKIRSELGTAKRALARVDSGV